MNQFWKDIPEYEGLYSISNLGNIWNHKFQKNMKSRLCKRNGYLKIGLTKDSKQTTFLVHRLVAIAFIPNPENKREVNHINLNKIDNTVNNLEWVTPKENVDWNRKNDRLLKGEQIGTSKLTNEIVIWFLTLLKENPKLNISKLSRETGLDRTSLSRIKNNKNWTHIKLGERNGKK